MNQRSDIDRVLQVWMTDGPTAIPDRVVDVVAARIGVQRQRRAWPFPGRTTVNTQIKLIAALAAAIVVAVVGYNMLPGLSSNAGGTTPPATASPAPATVAPSAAPTATARPASTPKTITYGSFGSTGLAITFDLPVGWGEFDRGWLFGPENPAGAGVLIFATQGLYRDPCQWDVAGTGAETQPGDLAVGADALELATALHTNSAYTSASAPAPVSVGSHAGYAVEIELPADLDFVGPTCDVVTGDQDGSYVVFGGFHFYPQGPSNRWQVSVVDVDDVQLAVILSYFEGTPADDLAAARALIESIEITP
jgi:hypothetical protein